jgi:Holliday junction resolvase RusA-like endonuclease
MCDSCHFVVNMRPLGKARHRTTLRHGRPHTYTPDATVDAEAAVRAAFRDQVPGWEPQTGPVEMSVFAQQTPPKSWPKWRRKAAIEEHWPVTVKPDWDNIGKLVGDALNGVAYVDDAQVCEARCRKNYGDTNQVSVFMHFCPPKPTTKAEWEGK